MANKLNIDTSQIKAVVFDLDGTLYESRHLPMHLILTRITKALMLQAERKARKQIMGIEFESEEALYNELFNLVAKSRKSSIEKVRAWYFNTYMPQMAYVLHKQYKARPHLHLLLDTLRSRGIRTAVFSDYGAVPAKLEALGLHQNEFDFIFDAPSLGGLKPTPRSFQRVAEQMNLTCSEILMIGDREDTDGGCMECAMPFVRLQTHKTKKIPADSLDYPLLTWEEVLKLLQML